MTKNKPPLVLLHGLFGSPLGLETITKDLQTAGYTVFVPAVPPFAGSEELWSQQQKLAPKNTSLSKRYADYFREYFAKNNITKPVLIGHSMGTLVASSIATHYPDLINEKIIFLSPISRSPSRLISKVSILSSYLPARIVDWITTQFLIIPRNPKFFRETLAMVHLCSYDQRPGRYYIKEATKFSTTTTVPGELGKAAPSKWHFQAYFLAGEHDRLVPPRATRKAVDALRHSEQFDCECEFLSETGHLHNYEKPHETAQRIVKFLDK